MTAPHLGTIPAIAHLADRLNAHESIRRHDAPDEPASWTLAKALSEIEESLLAIHEHLLPALLAAATERETGEALVDLANELRHVIYHAREAPPLAVLVGD